MCGARADDCLDEYYSRASAQKADKAEPHIALAQWCLEQNRPDKAREELEKALAASPDNPKARALLGFQKADKAWLTPLIEAIADAAPFLAQGDEGRFMNRVCVLTQQTPEE